MSRVLRLLERLELIIPGYRGYKKKELIREDDKLVREKVASILDDARREVESLLIACSQLGSGAVALLDRERRKLMMVASRIRHAAYGYAGYFDRVKVTERELEKLLEYDYNLVSRAEDVAKAVSELRGVVGDDRALTARLMELDRLVDDLDKLIIERDRVFKVEG